MVILPCILESQFEAFEKKISLVCNNSHISRIHVDVIEPAFVDNKTLFPNEWPVIPDNLQMDIHLMVQKPLTWIETCQAAKGGLLIAHIEKLEHPQAWIKAVHSKNLKAGIAIDLETDITMIDRGVLLAVNQILIMSIQAGFAGQVFRPAVIDKIRYLRQIGVKSAEICVDGGINKKTAVLCQRAGATVLAVNTWLWQDFIPRWQELQKM